MYNIKYIDHSADIGFEIIADNLAELIIGAIKELFKTIIEVEHVSIISKKKFVIRANDNTDLLYSSLKQVLDYYFRTGFIIKEVSKVKLKNNKKVKIICQGQYLDFEKDEGISQYLTNEVKSITYHQMEIKQLSNGQYSSIIILDV